MKDMLIIQTNELNKYINTIWNLIELVVQLNKYKYNMKSKYGIKQVYKFNMESSVFQLFVSW